MPVYEFFCTRCNTIYSFYSKRIDTETIPLCPDCTSVELKRQLSLFSTISSDRRGDDDMADDGLSSMDEARMERAMEMLAREAEGIDEDDPRQAAQLMRRLAESAGLGLNPQMEEVLSRLERGEDPEQIEEDLGDLMDDDNPFIAEGARSGVRSRKNRPPRVDERLYDLQEHARPSGPAAAAEPPCGGDT